MPQLWQPELQPVPPPVSWSAFWIARRWQDADSAFAGFLYPFISYAVRITLHLRHATLRPWRRVWRTLKSRATVQLIDSARMARDAVAKSAN